MASSSFDELTKVLATSTSRRQAIRVLFASVLGSTLGFGGIGAAQAEGDCDQSPATDLCGNPNDNFGIWGNKIKGCVQNPGTCTGEVDLSHTPPQWVLFKESSTNYTLFAGQRRKGIECPEIWHHTNPNYWRFAWDAANNHLSSQVKKDKIGLAINSRAARTECQLHIHVSCIRSDVQTALKKADSKIPVYPHTWDLSKPVSLMTNTKGPRDFLAFILPGSTLLFNSQNLFQVLHHMITSQQMRPSTDMQYQTLVVAQRPLGGFYILTSEDKDKKKNPNQKLANGIGAGEELLSKTCT
jgi:CDP-diacylglycerol pyrophosphatase